MAAKGFFTDTTVCIGCKACEVACKQWNQLPDDGFSFSGHSYDNTQALSADTWRHVTFLERQVEAPLPTSAPPLPPGMQNGGPQLAWLMMSDVCKHCQRAGCLEACPTGAILRTEHDSVYVQPDVCNGCGYCVAACPFGVIARREEDGRAWKCTLCYDRLQEGQEPACAASCPTDSIVFGDLDALKERARQRVEVLQAQGVASAHLYGVDAEEQPGTGGLNAFFLLTDAPERYNLPPNPVVPTVAGRTAWGMALGAAAGIVAAAMLATWVQPGGRA